MNIESSILIRNLLILVFILLILIIYYLIHIGNRHIENSKQIRINKKKGLPIIAIIIFVYIFFLLTQKYEILSETLITIIISVILSYLFNPIINYLEKHNIPRSLGILMLYVVILGIIIAISFSIIPRLGREIGGLLAISPEYFKDISEFMNDLYTRYYSNVDSLPPIVHSIEEVIFDNIDRLQDLLLSNVSKLFTGMGEAFSRIISLILIPILTFYFLRDKDEFSNKLYLTIPKNKRKDARELFLQIDRALSQFIRGRLILAIYVGIVTTVLLLILDVNFAIVIGLITGIADIIPYFGPFLGFLPAVIFAFLDSPLKGIWVGVAFVIIQWVENNVLAPKVIGDSTGIHPITVLLSLIIAGGMFGVAGMIFSVPVVAILKIFFGFFMDKIRKRKLISK